MAAEGRTPQRLKEEIVEEELLLEEELKEEELEEEDMDQAEDLSLHSSLDNTSDEEDLSR